MSTRESSDETGLASGVGSGLGHSRPMKPPIAILFANLKGNIGDFAILQAILLELGRRFAGHPLHVFSHQFHGVDEKRLSAFKRAAPEFELIGTTYAPDARRSFARLMALFRASSMVQAREVRSLAARSIPGASRFRDYEAIFLVGGAHWSGRKVGTSMFGTLMAVHHHNDRIYAFPFSVSPSLRRYNSAAALKQYFSMIRAPLIVRDGKTKAMMDELGLAAVLGADCVFSLEDFADQIEPMGGREHSRIVFVVTGGSLKDLRLAIRRIGRPAGQIALLTTCELEDGEALEALSGELQIPYYAPTTWQEVVAELKASSLVVTNRLHGLILGSFAKTPLLPVADRQKVEAFALDAAMPHSLAGLHLLDRDRLERCLSDRDLILERMAEYQKRTRTEALSPLMGRTTG
jgi:polysaccharide pyruvyl transferase WcaK-like protein